MKKKLAAEHIDFADSRYKFFEMTEDSTLTIHMDSWKETPLRIVFAKVIQFSYKLGDLPKDLYETSGDCPLLMEALASKYEKIPTSHPYKLFELEDIDDFPFIQIVAVSINVFKD